MKSRILLFSCFIFISSTFYSCTKYAGNLNKSTDNNNNSSIGTGSSGSGSGSSSSGNGSSGSGSGSSSSGSGSSGSGSGSSSSGNGSTGSGSGYTGSGSGYTGSGSGSTGSGSGSTGSGSGSTGSGSGSTGSGSGSTGSGSGSTGSGTGSSSSGSGNGSTSVGTANIQGIDYSNTGNVRLWADNFSLLSGETFSTISAGNVAFKMTYNTSDILNVGTVNLTANSNYSYITYNGLSFGYGGMILENGATAPAANRAFVRFINLDPSTNSNPLSCLLLSSTENVSFQNRKYIDNKTDVSLSKFSDINAGTFGIKLMKNNNEVVNFLYPFEQGKKYTIAALIDYGGSSFIRISKN